MIFLGGNNMAELNFCLTADDRLNALEVAKRATTLIPGIDRMSVLMDLSVVHNHHYKLDFERMASADDFNLAHDIAGIAYHLNRSTGKLRDCFVPRFAV
jgi:hypothetical protein